MKNSILQSITFFIVAGLMEIGGGYLMWLWLREKRSGRVGALGGLIIVCYGIVPTFQPASFGRVYAAYGGAFIVLSVLWGWWIDGQRPDIWDVIGAAVCCIGIVIIVYAPRAS